MGFLRKNPEGTHVGQVRDAYPGVAADITRLQKEVRPPTSLGEYQDMQSLCSHMRLYTMIPSKVDNDKIGRAHV